MYRSIIFAFILLFTLNSCGSEDKNLYFKAINNEITKIQRDHRKIETIYNRELGKYKRTHDEKYLVSSKYAEYFLFPDNKLKKISLIYELLKINDNKYDYITIACNFFLAFELERTSQKLSLQFLNDAIKIDERNKETHFLAQLYHLKARLYFTHKNYTLAKFYFNKALHTFDKKDKLHIAAMYSSFGVCDQRTGNFDSAIQHTEYGIKILQSKPNLNNEELFILYKMKGNLGVYYFLYKKNYLIAEKLLNQEVPFYEDKKESDKINSRNLKALLEIYLITHQVAKEKEVVGRLLNILPQLKTSESKIYTLEALYKYYLRTHDFENIKLYSQKLIDLNNDYREENAKEMDNTLDILNIYTIKNINQKYTEKIASQRRRNILLTLVIVILIIVFIKIVLTIRNKTKKEKKALEKEKLLLEDDKKDLEDGINKQEGKIKNLYMNLSLKIETEKAFLENLKKIKRSKNIDPEETVKDLYFKTNNLLQIDKKNESLVSESSIENKLFMKRLSEKHPHLTDYELRLCVYFRLNLSSKEISLLTNITPGSVRVYKSKIKSKIELEKEEELTAFLNSI